MFQPHLLQIHLQLFGDQHGDGRVGALAHLDIGHGQDDLPIASDADEGIGRERPARGAFGCVSSTRREADDESSAHRCAHGQEAATGKIYAGHISSLSCRSPARAPRA